MDVQQAIIQAEQACASLLSMPLLYWLLAIVDAEEIGHSEVGNSPCKRMIGGS